MDETIRDTNKDLYIGTRYFSTIDRSASNIGVPLLFIRVFIVTIMSNPEWT